MKKILWILIFSTALTFPVLACAEKTGLGIIFGSVTGVSFKQYMDKHTAYDLALGMPYGYEIYSGVAMHGDIMWTDEIDVSKGALLFHLGGGAAMAVGSGAETFELGLRFTTGLEYFFHRSKFAVFAEIVPTLMFISDLEGRLQGGLGGRFYF
jgi:hypothetical protein